MHSCLTGSVILRYLDISSGEFFETPNVIAIMVPLLLSIVLV